eukprot:CAMPEP_0169299950 /NCGR_PEP_ID=MMETSP1016-20121227/67356_1 /TAXON_ID=342587 /ORGANISM="Karlodinium micrum, Strain CCMP2283" /LENGTH=54 /DNA_ID=CAMNT_0009392261 /DNA_START=210 /DNA_END=374 /DNA_ORIENTATION=+
MNKRQTKKMQKGGHAHMSFGRGSLHALELASLALSSKSASRSAVAMARKARNAE